MNHLVFTGGKIKWEKDCLQGRTNAQFNSKSKKL